MGTSTSTEMKARELGDGHTLRNPPNSGIVGTDGLSANKNSSTDHKVGVNGANIKARRNGVGREPL